VTRHAALSLLLLGAFALGGCAASRDEEPPPGEQFGTRLPDEATVETLQITRPGEEESFYTIPAVLDGVTLRVEPFEPGTPAAEGTRVEALVKGAFPDACSALHTVEQERALRINDVMIEMRRPQGQLCATVVRPFRYYLMLDGTFTPGAYTLLVNGKEYPFVVREPEAE
jgi:hypothetical protein